MVVKISEERKRKYKRAGYRIIGKHSAIEICRWTKSVLRGGRNCYKRWFGIRSHRCIQFTPALDLCNFTCLFCWRSFGEERFKFYEDWDEPNFLIEEAFKAQKELISGFGGNPKTPKQIFKEANEPKHFAISLDGEPTLYPFLSKLIKAMKRRKLTAFLVTNGTLPNKLKELREKKAEPTNLYVSVYGTSEKDYKKICKPFIKNAFELVKESLRSLEDFKCRTVLRITCVEGLNMKNAKEFAELVKLANPDFFELKGYTWIGESRFRLKKENMPTLASIEKFGLKINKWLGYKLKGKDSVSRVLLWVRDEATWEKNLRINRKIEKNVRG